MAYLKKNINMTMLVLLAAITIILIGITVFFQLGLKTRTTDFEVASENLTACVTQLTNYKDRLDQAEEQIASSSQDIRRYDQLYDAKQEELSEIAGDLESTQRQVANLQLIKGNLESERAQLQQNVRELDQTLTLRDERIEQLEEDVDLWKDKFSCCKNQDSIDQCIDEC